MRHLSAVRPYWDRQEEPGEHTGGEEKHRELARRQSKQMNQRLGETREQSALANGGHHDDKEREQEQDDFDIDARAQQMLASLQVEQKCARDACASRSSPRQRHSSRHCDHAKIIRRSSAAGTKRRRSRRTPRYSRSAQIKTDKREASGSRSTER